MCHYHLAFVQGFLMTQCLSLSPFFLSNEENNYKDLMLLSFFVLDLFIIFNEHVYLSACVCVHHMCAGHQISWNWSCGCL